MTIWINELIAILYIPYIIPQLIAVVNINMMIPDDFLFIILIAVYPVITVYHTGRQKSL